MHALVEIDVSSYVCPDLMVLHDVCVQLGIKSMGPDVKVGPMS